MRMNMMMMMVVKMHTLHLLISNRGDKLWIIWVWIKYKCKSKSGFVPCDVFLPLETDLYQKFALLEKYCLTLRCLNLWYDTKKICLSFSVKYILWQKKFAYHLVSSIYYDITGLPAAWCYHSDVVLCSTKKTLELGYLFKIKGVKKIIIKLHICRRNKGIPSFATSTTRQASSWRLRWDFLVPSAMWW